MTERTEQFVYDDQQLVAIVRPVYGGWRPIVRGKEVGVFRRREDALKAIDDGV